MVSVPDYCISEDMILKKLQKNLNDGKLIARLSRTGTLIPHLMFYSFWLQRKPGLIYY